MLAMGPPLYVTIISNSDVTDTWNFYKKSLLTDMRYMALSIGSAYWRAMLPLQYTSLIDNFRLYPKLEMK